MVRYHLPEEVNILISTLEIKINIFPDGRFYMFKERFRVGRYSQQEGVD